ncbi:flagellar export chaperone FliS [Paenibacillus sp. Marseille-Q7038]
MTISPYNSYRNSAVQTASPVKLLIMLYDGAIRFINAGIEGIDTVDYQKANTNLGKAQSIISELSATLDRSMPISNNLEAIYEYITHLLTQSNINKDDTPAKEALGYLQDLRATWEQASRMSAVSGN